MASGWIWKRELNLLSPDRNGTIINFQVFNNFALYSQKIEQKFTQTPNNSFLFIDTSKSSFEMINSMTMRFFKTGNVFILFRSGEADSALPAITFWILNVWLYLYQICHHKARIDSHKVTKNCACKCVE